MPEILKTNLGSIQESDSLLYMREHIPDDSIDLIVTSPPFALFREKDYGNKAEDEYVAWFRDFGEQFYRILKPSGSLVIDIGGSWIPGQPTRSLYHFELLIMLCREFQFNLAQEFYWWNPSKLPSPAEWVNVRRIRVKDAINSEYWLSKTPWPKASNRRILVPYSDSMEDLLERGYDAQLRPSGHDISDNFAINNNAAIPPNLIAIPNTESNSSYMQYCKNHELPVHPARFPASLPEFFIRMLTDEGDLVFDPFAGSCIVGSVCERLNRRWICCEMEHNYVLGAVGRFVPEEQPEETQTRKKKKKQTASVSSGMWYKINHPGCLWDANDHSPLPQDGGKVRILRAKTPEQLEAKQKARMKGKTNGNGVASNGLKQNTEETKEETNNA